MTLVDAHAHLQDAPCPQDVAGLLAASHVVGVTHVVCCGTHPADWPALLQLAKDHRSIIPMLGLHPWWVTETYPQALAHLETLLLNHPIGLGECGLDFSQPTADRAQQEACLRFQLRLAKRFDRPVALHCVHAWARLLTIVEEEGVHQGGLIHGFRGSADLARAFQKAGLHLSFGPDLLSATAAQQDRYQRALQAVAPHRLLLETDTHLPKKQSLDKLDLRPGPSILPAIAVRAAELRGEDPQVLGAHCAANALHLLHQGL